MSQLPYKCGNADTVECLYGVYLLYSLNPKYKGRTYIGYTVNPKRRLNQHNKGQLFGGARRTNNRGPWEMVLLVHGFPNDISALRFEWAWQHPERSRRLQTIEKKKRKETHYVYRLRVLQLMLNMGPWSKLPLTVRWLADQYQPNSKVDLYPPTHMPIAAGPVYPRKPESKNTSVFTPTNCSLCSTTVSSEDRVSCVVPCCDLVAHIRCLAGHFIKESEDLLPVEGICPACKFSVLWGDIVRSKILNSL